MKAPDETHRPGGVSEQQASTKKSRRAGPEEERSDPAGHAADHGHGRRGYAGEGYPAIASGELRPLVRQNAGARQG